MCNKEGNTRNRQASIDKTAESNYDGLAPHYDGLDRSKGEAEVFFDLEHSRDLLWQMMCPYLPQDRESPILELGAGTGRWTLRLLDAGYKDITCVDISREMLKRLKEKVERSAYSVAPNIIHADTADLSMLPDDAMAFVLQIGGAFAGASPLGCLREARRVSCPGAKLFFDADNLSHSILFLLAEGKVAEAAAVLESGERICYQPSKMTYWFRSKWVEALAKTGWRHLATFGSPGTAMERYVRAFLTVDHKQMAADIGKERLAPFELAFAKEPTLLGLNESVFFVAENCSQRQIAE